MKKIYTTIFILCAFLISGCDDFLQEESRDEVKVQTIQDFGELLLGSGYPDTGNPIFACLYTMDDDLEVDEDMLRPNDDVGLLAHFACFTWQPDMWDKEVKMSEPYTPSYNRIMGCNAVLDGIDDALGGNYGNGEVERARVKAEALTVRAYFYFNLVNLFGKPYHTDKTSPGVPLKLVSGLKEEGFERATVEEVYNQIVSDLETASSLLENLPKTRGDFRINYPSVNIILSRVYLFMERWDDVVKAADKAIKSGGDLTDYTKIQDTEGFYFTSYDHSEVEWIYGADNKSVGMAIMTPSKDLLSQFDPDDRRFDLYFGMDDYYYTFVVKKQNSLNQALPANVLRTSEAYLNRAEAYAKAGKSAEALKDLNELRKNRIIGYTPVTTADAQTLLEDIRLERRKELCFEEHRWFDLRRYGMPSISHKFKSKIGDNWKVYTLKENDPLYTLPIPQICIERNPALEQNTSRKEPLRVGVDE